MIRKGNSHVSREVFDILTSTGGAIIVVVLLKITPAMVGTVSNFAGQQLLTGQQAQVYANYLLEVFAFSKIGAVMLWGAIASFVLAALMSILVGLGFWHARRTEEATPVLTARPVTVQ